MKKVMIRTVFWLVISLLATKGFGQNAVVMLKFEDAEKSYNNQDYQQTIALLDEVEKEAGVTSRTLYLRIVTENKLFNEGHDLFQNIIEYDRLDKLRQLSSNYLKALSDQGLDDKYREVYRISESLSDYPKSKEDWKVAREAFKKDQEAAQQAQQLAIEKEAARKKSLELMLLKRGTLTMDRMQFHKIASLREAASAELVTLYIIRPEEGTRNMNQMLYLNDELIEKKMKPGAYMQFHFTPGLVKIGKLYAKNKRKVSTGAALLMGGVVGLAATSGKTIAQNEHLFFLEMEPGKTYYVSSVITKDKKILFKSIEETKAKALMKAK
ncbi:hypothetical protein GCM10027566_28330 [Arachidicoccus ginsenosidivorans]|uniref:Uncharacterized protein n=1 Tax=Arachidicoccus ginsenosidivorans TaxID=496057 RepID=A0A5B8VRI1_9BACT|nr:hypothetical protein [Arachidicoccus ginsenosidivorans]QEC73701.1 hypothetical protein FSB73_20570 [Arachidicoccus ginsenosidivorans]